MEIESLDVFMDVYPKHAYLEDRYVYGRRFVRYSNGLHEGSHHESEWFCGDCLSHCEGGLPDDGVCEVCDPED